MKRLLSAVAIVAAIGTSLPASAGDLRSLVDSIADRNGVPRAIAHAVITVESEYRCGLTGSRGERGIMQVKPVTASEVGVTGNLYNCETGLRAGMRYLKIAIRRGGPGCVGVSFYQRGIYAKKPQCTAYGRRVMAALGQH